MSLQNSCANKTKFQPTKIHAFTNKILSLSYENPNKHCLLLEVFLKETLSSLQHEVISFLKVNIAMKYNMELHAIYIKPYMKVIDKTSIQQKVFKTDMQESFNENDFLQNYFTQVEILKRRTENFQDKEGGWALLELVKVDFKLAKYQPLRGGSALILPKNLGAKRACINVLNNDVFCFKWALLSALADVERRYRTSSYKVNITSQILKVKDLELNFKGLQFPLQIKDVPKFEKNNPAISINVFGYDEIKDLVIGPYYKTKKKRVHHINILYIDQNNGDGHYVWIKNFARLIGSQVSGRGSKIAICDACLQHFSINQIPENHIESCGQKRKNISTLERCALEYKNSIKSEAVPFVIYANMKTFSKTTSSTLTGNAFYVFKYFIKCSYDSDLNKWHTIEGANAPREFAESLIKDIKYYYEKYLSVRKPKIPLTEQEDVEFQNKSNCCLCTKLISDDIKAKLHCRVTGKYKGPVHQTCALNYKVHKKFPVIFANLSRDDCILMIKHLIDIDDDYISVRPLNNVSSISFQKDIKIDTAKLELRILNFSNFLSCGLNNVIKMMTNTDFNILRLTYPEESKFKLALTETLYPYDYLNGTEQLEENCLPGIEHFYDSALNEECPAEHYAHAQNMWHCFECKTLQDYINLCLKIDIVLLADVFEKFRLVCLHTYNLEPCHYYSAAEFSWDAMLQITDVKLSLPTDTEMCMFLERGMRLGISKCFHMRSVANNKYLRDYNSQLPSKYLMCFHANDIYGRVMTDYLPEGQFEWESDLNISLDSIPNDSEYGYIFEVDLEYPSSDFETHKILPFCCENVNLSDTDEKQLVIAMSNKFNYISYYKNLQQCLKHGLTVRKIHRILKFKQSNWMKKYIVLNKTLGSNNNDAFGAKVLSLMNTALYEKIMETTDKKLKFMTKWESDRNIIGARASIAKPHFTSVDVFDEQLVTIEYNTNVLQYVPVYLKLIVSELVKLKMYSFHYDYILSKYSKTNVELNYIDSDYLIYTITTDDLYRDIKSDIYSMINATDIDNSRQLLNTLGMMKDGNKGGVVKEFIGFRTKLYTLKMETMPDTSDNYVPNKATLANYIKLLYKYDVHDSNDLFKLKLYQNYASLYGKQLLPLSYLENNSNVLSNEIMNKLSWLYYQKASCENYTDGEDIMDVD